MLRMLIVVCAIFAMFRPVFAESSDVLDPSKCQQQVHKFSCPSFKLTWEQFQAYEKKIGARVKPDSRSNLADQLSENLDRGKKCPAPCVYVNGLCSCRYIILPSSVLDEAQFAALKAAAAENK